MLKRLLRRWIAWSSHPPFDRGYRLLYRVVAGVAAGVLGRQPDVVAVYLCRGCARNAIRPGISDIDSTVVCDDPTVEAPVRRVRRILGTMTGATSATARTVVP